MSISHVGLDLGAWWNHLDELTWWWGSRPITDSEALELAGYLAARRG